MAQSGYLFPANGAWYVRYREGGEQRCHRLASKADYPLKTEVEPLRDKFMATINSTATIKNGGATVAEFYERTYVPAAEKRLKPSTISGYKKAWNAHLKDRIGKMRVRDVKPMHIQEVMDKLGEDYGTKLTHDTYKWLKSSMSAIFTEAVRRGLFEANPVHQRIIVPKGRKRGRKRYACSLLEIQQHLEVFAGDAPITVEDANGMKYTPTVSRAAVRALIGTAAYAGLRQGEVRGLCAEDDKGDVLVIQRTVWGTELQDETKTGEDEVEPGMVPIIPQFRTLLDEVKPKHGFIFLGSRNAVLDLDNLAARVMRPVFKAHGLKWYGWHAYRRGLASNLKELGIDDLVIQAILRHTDVRTTQRHYIKTVPKTVKDAMGKLGEAVAHQQHVM